MAKSSTSTTNYKITQETNSIMKNISLVEKKGVKTLKAKNYTTIFEVTYKLHPKTNQPSKVISRKQVNEIIEPIVLDLFEITAEELAVYRKNGLSAFVLKTDGKFYFSVIPRNINFVSSNIIGAHQCAIAGRECRRISAASDALGGCAKIREHSKCIERYPWITTGYETFNTLHDSFVVTNCLHYEKCPPRSFSTEEI